MSDKLWRACDDVMISYEAFTKCCVMFSCAYASEYNIATYSWKLTVCWQWSMHGSTPGNGRLHGTRHCHQTQTYVAHLMQSNRHTVAVESWETGLCYAQNSLHTFLRNFPVPVDGEVAHLFRTCYGETGVMDFGLYHRSIGLVKMIFVHCNFPQQISTKSNATLCVLALLLVTYFISISYNRMIHFVL